MRNVIKIILMLLVSSTSFLRGHNYRSFPSRSFVKQQNGDGLDVTVSNWLNQIGLISSGGQNISMYPEQSNKLQFVRSLINGSYGVINGLVTVTTADLLLKDYKSPVNLLFFLPAAAVLNYAGIQACFKKEKYSYWAPYSFIVSAYATFSIGHYLNNKKL